MAEKDLTLDKAVGLAQSVEMAGKGAKTFSYLLRTVQNFTDILRELFQAVRASQGKLSTRKLLFCFCCGGRHLATKCGFISEECRSRGKQGHMGRVYRSAPGKHSDSKNPEPNASSKGANQLSEELVNTKYSLFQSWEVTVNHYRPICWWKGTSLQWK